MSTSAPAAARFSVSVSVVEADGFAYRTTSNFADAAAAARRRAVYERWLRRSVFVLGAEGEWNAGRSGWKAFTHQDGRYIVLSFSRNQH